MVAGSCMAAGLGVCVVIGLVYRIASATKKGDCMEIGARIVENQPFPRLMGVEIVSADKDKVRAQLLVRPDLCTAGHIMHGGAIMAFADTLGAIGAVLNMPREANTTTIESKTN